MQQRSLTNTARANASFQQALVDNADTLKQWGVTPGDNFIGGKTYVDGGGMQWRSNAALAREQMTPEQLAKNDAYLAAKADRKATAQQMRTQRAQYQNAQRGTGVMYNPDGTIDYHNTMMARSAAFNPVETMRQALASQQQEVTLATQRAAMEEAVKQGEYNRGDTAHQRALELARVIDPNFRSSIPEDERIQNQIQFASRTPEEQQAIFYAANDQTTDPARANAIAGTPNDWLISEYARLHENPNWFVNDAAESTIRDQRKAKIEAEMRRRGIPIPQIRQQQPFFSLSPATPTPPSQVVPFDYTAPPMM